MEWWGVEEGRKEDKLGGERCLHVYSSAEEMEEEDGEGASLGTINSDDCTNA